MKWGCQEGKKERRVPTPRGLKYLTNCQLMVINFPVWFLNIVN